MTAPLSANQQGLFEQWAASDLSIVPAGRVVQRGLAPRLYDADCHHAWFDWKGADGSRIFSCKTCGRRVVFAA